MANTKSSKSNQKSGGMLTGMRTGMKRAVGSPTKGGNKKPVSFFTVLAWCFAAAFALFLVWAIQ
ncbi:MAG: hypothetical protein HUU55_21400 [Myxococcales bacterium]|nr:hypothetical protein [Myxococcales bacterium]